MTNNKNTGRPIANNVDYFPHKCKDDKELTKYSKIACIILSWNISNLVIDKIIKLNKRIKIIYT